MKHKGQAGPEKKHLLSSFTGSLETHIGQKRRQGDISAHKGLWMGCGDRHRLQTAAFLLMHNVLTAGGKERWDRLWGADEGLSHVHRRSGPSKKEFILQLSTSHIVH